MLGLNDGLKLGLGDGLGDGDGLGEGVGAGPAQASTSGTANIKAKQTLPMNSINLLVFN